MYTLSHFVYTLSHEMYTFVPDEVRAHQNVIPSRSILALSGRRSVK
jgi:hypothetical protein